MPARRQNRVSNGDQPGGGRCHDPRQGMAPGAHRPGHDQSSPSARSSHPIQGDQEERERRTGTNMRRPRGDRRRPALPGRHLPAPHPPRRPRLPGMAARTRAHPRQPAPRRSEPGNSEPELRPTARAATALRLPSHHARARRAATRINHRSHRQRAHEHRARAGTGIRTAGIRLPCRGRAPLPRHVGPRDRGHPLGRCAIRGALYLDAPPGHCLRPGGADGPVGVAGREFLRKTELR
jgi:hypothetical protein